MRGHVPPRHGPRPVSATVTPPCSEGSFVCICVYTYIYIYMCVYENVCTATESERERETERERESSVYAGVTVFSHWHIEQYELMPLVG